MSIGTSQNPLIKDTTIGLVANNWRGIICEVKSVLTSIPGVYDGGDAVTGAATGILAIGAGKTAAASSDDHLS
jgi:glutamate synthase (NADPH) small chain